MKYKDKQGIFKDERTVQIEHKLGYEITFLTIFLLLLSILVKLVFLRLDWQACVPEIGVIVILELYAAIRSWRLGFDIGRFSQTSDIRTRRNRLANGTILMIIILVVLNLSGNSANRLFFAEYPVLKFIWIFVGILLFSSLLDKVFHYFYQKKERKLEKELEEN